ncbi:TonB-linked SusC/RagA family outer membrane protein [Pedobacter sp. AK017]|nr:TonB-linked SusC/RagA family outer membrane protein [Pedobacter sp. AK017]
MMKVITFLLLAFCLQVSASVYAQQITIKEKNAPLQKVMQQIRKQSGYSFIFDTEYLKLAKPVNVDLKGKGIEESLRIIFENQPFEYEIKGKSIILSPKTVKDNGSTGARTIEITGKVVDKDNIPIPGVTIKVKGTSVTRITGPDGLFNIPLLSNSAALIFSFVGYETKEVSVNNNVNDLVVVLEQREAALQEVNVVSTGYQDIPKERATGSFTQIDNQLLNRRVSTNILDRLDGIASGLSFNKAASSTGLSPSNEKLGISIRGRVTIDEKVSADPLIVLDNFPYEGDINNINPNDVESITILKDAAAASIWGARSGNGVIVITTKKGRFNQPLKVDFNANLTVGAKPNLKYSRNYLASTDYIDVELYLYDQHFYDNNLANTTTYPVISPIVEILAKKTSGALSSVEAENLINNYRGIDVRDESKKYFTQNAIAQQYALGLRGGAEKSTYSLSFGYDQNRATNVGNSFGRLSANLTNTYVPIKNLELTGSIIYSQSNQDLGFVYTSLLPYNTLADENGNPMVVPYGFRSTYLLAAQALGFLDWGYRPLQELRSNDVTVKAKNTILRGAARYKFTSYLDVQVQYQYENESYVRRTYRDPESYEARNNINKYAQRSSTGIFTYPYPQGGILYLTNQSVGSNNFRAQINYQQEFSQRHFISAIGGAEIREVVRGSNGSTLFGYNDDTGTAVTNLNYNTFYPVNPSGLGTQQFPQRFEGITGTTNRFVSYYINGSYSYLNKYTFSASGRKDGANIFGVKTNDKITPLWSAGLAYEISKEPFYKFDLIPYLKIRATYGYNGNVYSGSAYLTATSGTSGLTGATTATVNNAPNPELRWEKIRNKNLAVDFASMRNRLSGTFEVYNKLGTDLIANAILEPSTGFTTYRGNAATVKTAGIDLTLNSFNTNGIVKWYTTFLYTFNKDKVISYDTKYTTSYLVNNSSNIADPARSGLYISEGNSLFGVYGYKWAGLDPANGDPQGYLNGEVSKNYTGIVTSNNTDNVVYYGSSRPTSFGALRNTFSYRGFSISANVTYKLNYFLRKRSIDLNYSRVLGLPNSDYYARWQQKGDELRTSVPSLVYPLDENRNTFYQNSEALIIKGDHVRLQDISLSYDFDRKRHKRLPFALLQIYGYINNIGILWRANKYGIDPDVSDYNFALYSTYTNPRTYALGLKANF